MLTGIQAQGLWNERLGFGTNHEGEVVIVEQSSWQCIDGYDYNKLFGPPPPAEQTVRTSPLKLLYIDKDLWRQGHVQKGIQRFSWLAR